jgi:glycosyltransferase involved in cell wall biosynthesis
MRVLWVADKIGYGSRLHGIGSYFKYVIPALADQSVIPVVLRCNDDLAKLLGREGIGVRSLQHMKGDPRTLLALARIIREEKIELLHLHGYGASAFGRVLSAWYGIPAIIHQHDSVSVAPWYGRLVDLVLKKRAFCVIAVSRSVAEFSIRKRSVNASQIRVLPNPIPHICPFPDAHIDEWRAQHDIPKNAKLVGSITRFDPVKGTSYAIRAFADVVRTIPDAYLILFGDGDERESLVRLADDLKIGGHIRFLGYQSDASRYLAALDCFLLPSINEGMPFALLESIAMGTPAVVTGVGGIPQIVRNEKEALIVPPRDAKAISRAVKRILLDREFADKISEHGLALSRVCGLTRHASALSELYERALTSAALPRSLQSMHRIWFDPGRKPRSDHWRSP